MSFRISGLDATPFQHLIGLPEDELRAHGAIRYVVDAKPGFPDRISLDDADIGETVLLLNYEHQPARTPYRASHAIFVRELSVETFDRTNELPPAMARRLISLRAYDASDMLVAADVVKGKDAGEPIEAMLAHENVSYIHAHYAKPGCFAATITRT